MFERFNVKEIENIQVEKIEKKSLKMKKGEQHLLYEGDNLLSLQHLKMNHNQKVDTIYIDPPYNKKNNDLRYTDDFKEKDILHLSYLEFMYPRLKLAKELLKESGLIFVSIGEQEQHRIRILLDYVFGEENFVSNIVWQNKYTIANDKRGIVSQTEYILVYAKNNKEFKIKNEPLKEEYVKKTYKNPDGDPRGPWRTSQMYKPKNKQVFTVYSPSGIPWEKAWNFSPESWERLESDGRIYWGKDGTSIPSKKIFLSENVGMLNRNLWLGDEVGYTSTAGDEIQQLFGDRNMFLFPKPLKLIQKIIRISTPKDGVILDFFAGSGTTGHATLLVNQEDEGNRRFILCTNNENNICEEVTYIRLKKVIEGYSYEKNKRTIDVKGISASLSYFKVKETL